MIRGSRFAPLDPEGRDEGNADMAALYDPAAADMVGVPWMHSAAAPLRLVMGLLRRLPLARLGRFLRWSAPRVSLMLLGAAAVLAPTPTSLRPHARSIVVLPEGNHVPNLMDDPWAWTQYPCCGTAIATPKNAVELKMLPEMHVTPHSTTRPDVSPERSTCGIISPCHILDAPEWWEAFIPHEGTSLTTQKYHAVPAFQPEPLEFYDLGGDPMHGGKGPKQAAASIQWPAIVKPDGGTSTATPFQDTGPSRRITIFALFLVAMLLVLAMIIPLRRFI